jgi:hypothetical protein
MKSEELFNLVDNFPTNDLEENAKKRKAARIDFHQHSDSVSRKNFSHDQFIRNDREGKLEEDNDD